MATVTTGTSSASGTSPAGKLLTAEEYFRLPTPQKPTELVRGEIVEMNQPGFRHGKICLRIGRLLDEFADKHRLGHVVSNDVGIITARNPDTVRGADVAFYSYQRLPKDHEPEGYPDVAPDLVFEVLSPSNRWPQVLGKVAEYLQAGVRAAVIVDPDTTTLSIYRGDAAQPPLTVLQKTDVFELPDILPGFSVPVKQLIHR